MIPKFTIARIMEEARIDEVVGEFVTLKKRGSSLIGNCPFHNEKTPSFNVSVSKGYLQMLRLRQGGQLGHLPDGESADDIRGGAEIPCQENTTSR